MYQKIIQFIKFGFVGASNTIMAFFIYYALVWINVNYIVANVAGYIVSSIWGYILNKKLVFVESTENTTKSIVKYYIVYGSSFVINNVCLYIFVEGLSISKIVAPVLTMCITVPYNFILNKIWAFKS